MYWSSALVLSLISLTSSTEIETETDFLPTEECPLLGPTFSSDFDLSKTDAFARAKAEFPKLIETLIESKVVSNSSSFVIDVYSTVTNTSLYTFTQKATAPLLNETYSSGELNDETIFRIGSVSKLYTVYAILVAGGGLETFDTPVTRYLPELASNKTKNPLKNIPWESITIGSLASHQAGTGSFPLESILCSPTSNDTCIKDFLNLMRDVKLPVQPVGAGGLYSDAGFGILGRVLERITGLPYNEALRSVLGGPLGLNSTVTFEPSPEDLNAVVIPGGLLYSGWGFDNQVTAGSGGIYCNAADLRTTGISILNSKLLSPSTIRTWMKPRAHTSSLTVSLGAPWEINRLTLSTSPGSNRTRVSDLYTKGGGQPGYTAIFALSPDHQIGYTVLVAGARAGADRWPLRAAVGEVFVSAAEHAGAENAARSFAGTFADGDSNVTLTVDKDHTGLGLKTFFVDGVDWRGNLTAPQFILPQTVGQIVRLYPTRLNTASPSGSKLLKYRAVAEITPKKPRARIEGGTGLFDDSCGTWFSAGFYDSEDNKTDDEFIFEVENGRLIGVEYPAAQKVLKRL